MAIMKLRGNLTGTASKIVENRCRDPTSAEPTIDGLFRLLADKCNNDEARINAKASYDAIRQRKDEKIADFVERFEKARMQAQMPDGPNAAMKFFKDLTCNVDNIPFDTKAFTNVQAVARSLAGLDLTALIRKRKQSSAKDVDFEEDSDPITQSKLAGEVRERQKKRRTLVHTDDEGDSQADNPKQQQGSEVQALIQSLAVLGERLLPRQDVQASRQPNNRGADTLNQRRRDSPLAGPVARGGRDSPDTVCQLCKGFGHEARHCRDLVCMQCHKFGHNEIDCREVLPVPKCQQCGKMGHTAKECEKNLRCHLCGRMGHSERRCRSKQPSNAYQSQRDSQPSRQQQRQPVADGACYKCGRPGHYARDCQSNSGRGTGTNAIPIRSDDTSHRRSNVGRSRVKEEHHQPATEDRRGKAQREQEN